MAAAGEARQAALKIGLKHFSNAEQLPIGDVNAEAARRGIPRAANRVRIAR